MSNENLIGSTAETKTAAVYGESTNDTNDAGPGVRGVSKAAGVVGESKTWHGVAGFTQSSSGGVGIYGNGPAIAIGVLGESTAGAGVEGRSQSGPGVFGQSSAAGVWGKSSNWHGVAGESASSSGGAGVYGKGQRAGLFEGNVDITGNLTIQGVSIQSWLQRIVSLELNSGLLAQRVASLEQKVTTQAAQPNAQAQTNSEINGLNRRMTTAEMEISDLEAKVNGLINKNG
jgi:uncharacterized coiled-coil protein SlyX